MTVTTQREETPAIAAEPAGEPVVVDNTKPCAEEKGWNSKHFPGEFSDSLGHQVYVVEAPGKPRSVYHAHFVKKGLPDKRFILTKHKLPNGYKRWMCGNGFFQKHASNFDKIVWKTGDGRENIWTRNPPKGPVYFDPPPTLQLDIEAMMQQFNASLQIDNGTNEEQQQNVASDNHSWNAGATEFVPPKSSLPKVQGTENKTMKVSLDGTLLWALDEKWSELKEMPIDFSVTSPQFDIDEIKNLQLAFFPRGRSVATFQGCSLQLTTGDMGSDVGIKFEVLINGFGQGTKTCLKKRWVGDFPRLDDKSTTNVVIGIKILEIFHEKNYNKAQS